MLITTKTANALLKKYLTGSTPITVNEDQQAVFFKTLKTAIKQHQTLQEWKVSSNHYNYRQHKVRRLSLSYTYESTYNDSETFDLEFRDQQLFISLNYQASACVYQLEQLYVLLEHLKQEIDRHFGEQLKKRKIKELKYQAISGKIKALAKTEEFDYYLQEYKTKIKLYVRMDHKVLEVDIQNNKFQAVLQELQAFIRSFRCLHQSGISFRFKSTSSSHRYNWIRHEEL